MYSKAKDKQSMTDFALDSITSFKKKFGYYPDDCIINQLQEVELENIRVHIAPHVPKNHIKLYPVITQRTPRIFKGDRVSVE